MKEQLDQVLILDGLEAGLDIIGLLVLCIGITGHYDKCQQISDSIHGVLVGLDWILVIVNFFAFVLPSYNNFVDIYENTDLLCYDGVYVTN